MAALVFRSEKSKHVRTAIRDYRCTIVESMSESTLYRATA